MSTCKRIDPLLDGYHDGELASVTRWRVGWHLRRCGPCRDALADLGRVGSWVRETAAGSAEPDLWMGIAARLATARADRVPVPAPRWRVRLGPPLLGAGALAAAAVSLLVLQPDLLAQGAEGVVRTLNTRGRPVMVFDRPNEPTIIWMMDGDGRRTLPEDAASVWI